MESSVAVKALDFLRTLKPSEAVSGILGATFGVSPAENADLIRHGFWHVSFFAQQFSWLEEDSSWIGVRIVPGAKLLESPVVSVNRFGAVTISPRLSDLIVNWLLYTQLEVENWEFVGQEWGAAKGELLEIHSELGGDPALFKRFETYLGDASNFSSAPYTNRASRALDYLKVDESTQTVMFREWMREMINDQTALPKLQKNFGGWSDYARSAIAARAYTLRGSGQLSLAQTVNAMWSGFDKAAPFDSDIGEAQQFHTSRDPADRLRSLALAVTQPWVGEGEIPRDIQNDPLLEAARALGSADSISAYNGVAHMEAAARLDTELGDGERSYDALVSAAFWSALSLGFPFKESYEAAVHIAERYGWTETLALLEGNAFELEEARA